MKTNPRGTKRLNKSKEKIATPCFDVSDDSEDEFVPKSSKKAKLVTSADFQELKSQINEMKEMLNDILQVNQEVSLPFGIVKLLRDAFMCKICHETPIKATSYSNKMLLYLAWVRNLC